jgi:hypothetical protein
MSAESPLVTTAGMVCLALAAALLASERERRLAGAGLLILGLALAAWHAGSAPGTALTPPGGLGQGFLVVNGGLLLVGAALVCAAVLRAPRAPLRTAAGLLALAGVVLVGPVLIAFIGAGGPLRAPAVAIGLGLTGTAGAVGARSLVATRPGRIVARRLAPPPLTPVIQPDPSSHRALAVLMAAVVTTALAPHTLAVFVGAALATWAGYLAFHRRGTRPVPVAPVLTLLLVPAYVLLATIAGPVGLSLEAVPQIPLSHAAELLVDPALLLAAWAAAGLWPLQRQLPGALTAPAGALLLARVAQPLGPIGLEYWRPLTAPVLVLGLWNAAAHARWSLLLAGGGFLGIAAGTRDGVFASLVLLATGLAVELCSIAPVPRRVRTLIEAAAWPLVTLAGVPALEAALRGQVVYTALGTLGLALIVAAGRARAGAGARSGSLIPPAVGSILPTESS